MLLRSLRELRDAYLYTGESKYGRAGAILLDRVADVYPSFDLSVCSQPYSNSHGFSLKGKILGRIWEADTIAPTLAQAVDAFFPMMDDPSVVRYLNDKAVKLGLVNDKSSPDKIRQNAEDGILREIRKACENANIYGNFGMPQAAMGYAAVVLDTMPESGEMIDWIFREGTVTTDGVTGGDVMPTLVNRVDRDGQGDETSLLYNGLWVTNLMNLVNVLAGYQGYPGADLYENPKFIKMLTASMPLTLCSRATAHIGDTSSTGGTVIALNADNLLAAYLHTGSPLIAQCLYFLNGNETEGLRGDIFTRDPESVAERIGEVIKAQGEYPLNQSVMLGGYGFAALKDGKYLPSEPRGTSLDNQRDFWMFFGRTGGGHGHLDALNLGIEAFGLNFAPDMGYPESADNSPHRMQWLQTTVAHNTVVVNDIRQSRIETNATPYHFDDAGRVKVMDADARSAYPGITDIYRRTVVSVDAGPDVSYAVDFFRVLGGREHVYSFHVQGNSATVEGLDMTEQRMGTYAGATVPWGANEAYAINGYSWLRNVRRDAAPEADFSVDFAIEDYRRVLESSGGLRLKLTMLQETPLNEAALATGVPPQVSGNPKELQWMLARRSGGDGMDTLFTAVLQPYRDQPYLKKSELVPVTGEGGEQPGDRSAAIKVTHTDGKIDYIVYATNNQIAYRVDDRFDFKGFVGVVTYVGEEIVYAYVNDGETAGPVTGGQAAVTGEVLDFTKSLSQENTILVKTDGAAAPEQLAGRSVYIQNDGRQNGAYHIVSAQQTADGLRLHLGNQTLIRSYRDSGDFSKGFLYNIAAGQKLRIPLSQSYDSGPVFSDAAKYRIAAGKTLRIELDAESPSGKPLEYRARSLPRGAQLDARAGILTWTPGQDQLGDHYAAVEAWDGALASGQEVEITVYNPGGAGADSTTEPGPDSPSSEEEQKPNPPVEESVYFDDLGGYSWAAEAINRLAADQIVNGTGPRTFSPGKNITRADFAILLTRLFALPDRPGENFDDVPKGAYYAEELRIAKANGIVLGVGDNRFLPTEAITRQDMMVILVRALDVVKKGVSAASESELAQFADAAQIAPYARDAAARLAAAGLVSGSDGRLWPLQWTTRAESAVLLDRILQKIQNHKEETQS